MTKNFKTIERSLPVDVKDIGGGSQNLGRSEAAEVVGFEKVEVGGDEGLPVVPRGRLSTRYRQRYSDRTSTCRVAIA